MFFFGGVSPEHDISIITGQLIIAGLKKLNIAVLPVYISKTGSWLINERLGNLKLFQNPIDEEQYPAFNLNLNLSKQKMVFEGKGLLSKRITIDLAFPSFHGQNGEDGTFQGLFELCNIPYVGCGVTASAITVDKVLTKQLYQEHHIPTTKFVYFTHKDWQEKSAQLIKKIKDTLGLPVIIKPACLGSSIGIGKAENQKELEFAIEVAMHYDSKVIVESYITNLKDITCAVLGNDNPQTSLLQETDYSKDLLSYDDKYLRDGGTQTGKASSGFRIPARLDSKTTKAIQTTALEIYRLLNCWGMARVDFLYDTKDKKFYANEINPLPGTLYHHLWQASGINLDKLLETLIKLAQEKHKEKQVTTKVFESSVLQTISGSKLRK